ncbi:hypothetical protein [Amycolatopsis nigrescens]|uniref:hypothetical protein n=1 Tax=Amycolatopsis nigrescens TaxID=381445 RepID=UPI00035E600E|nr:hypothetical protein [Amycolatopsis nigrescens]
MGVVFGRTPPRAGAGSKAVRQVRQTAQLAGLGAEYRLFEERPQRPGAVLAVYQHGLVYLPNRWELHVLPWREIAGIDLQRRPGTKVLTGVCLRPAVGQEVSFAPEVFERWPGVSGSEVLDLVSARFDQLGAEVRTALDRGGRVPWGALELDASGVHAPGYSLWWRELTRVQDLSDRLLLFDSGARHQAALHVPADEIPSRMLLLDLAEEQYLALHGEPLPVHQRRANPQFGRVFHSLDLGRLQPPESSRVPRLRESAFRRGLHGAPRWYTSETGFHSLALYNHGFALAVDSVNSVTAYHWDDVDRVATHDFEVVAHGEPVLNELLFPGARKWLASAVLETHSGYLLDRAEAEFGKGRTFRLGSVLLGRDGFGYRGWTHRWEQVVSVGTSGGEAKSAPAVTVRIEGEDTLRIEAAELGNAQAFLTLANLLGGRRR